MMGADKLASVADQASISIKIPATSYQARLLGKKLACLIHPGFCTWVVA